MRLARKMRMRLRTGDGTVYLSRWGVEFLPRRDEAGNVGRSAGGIYLHRMRGPDPGVDLHDHPFTFATLVLWGGYTEERALAREAPQLARYAEWWPGSRGPRTTSVRETRRPGRWRTMRLDECHRITGLLRRSCWTLVVRGPRRRGWGFYLPDTELIGGTGFVHEQVYKTMGRRDMVNDRPNQGPDE